MGPGDEPFPTGSAIAPAVAQADWSAAWTTMVMVMLTVLA